MPWKCCCLILKESEFKTAEKTFYSGSPILFLHHFNTIFLKIGHMGQKELTVINMKDFCSTQMTIKGEQVFCDNRASDL